ncbi:CheR family methyltransferase [Desulfovulcanus ferrireducens]|uniref:CheR family methyltransferase n=1 Tax=Desulfovulcanus ferrireducens TaxID=2831190 RepID=UPI00207BCEB5|nr:protein-glutamate O-methyltransferase CheR [Desulfovulcanus ferrireducens]
MSQIKISDADFERFRDYFYRKTGIYFGDSKRYFVDKRLIERIKATGHRNFRSYFTFMRFQASGKEFQELVNLMTVNETYFFREEYQLKCMVESVLPEIVQRKKKELIRIWSIPCSTGEEPYSIAIYLLEYWPLIDEVDVEIVASDIDTKVLEKSKQGIYNSRSVQYLPREILRKYFKQLSGGRYLIDQDLREAIDFRQINICDFEDTKKMRDFDLIFCRNLLIYFDDVSRRKAAEAFYDSLNPGGIIFLGHSESMSRITSLFKVRKFPQAIVYQKPLTTWR